MFDWLFPPSCPCDPAAKAWVEKRLSWLNDQFDDHAFNGRRIVLPTPEYFPDPYDGSEDAVRTLLNRVGTYMDVETESISLELIAQAGKLWLVNEKGNDIAQTAGTYERGYGKSHIRIDKSGLEEPMSLVGTMAHELAHVRLLGENRVRSTVYDNELLTDLTVVFFGLGVFLANTPRNSMSQNTKWPGTNLVKPEYMTPPMFGYALAHLAWFRGEQKPPWASHLHWNARPDFKQGVRYLFKTSDSTFRPLKLR